MVIPAAGQARRFGSDKNKIWAELNGRPVWDYTLDAFNAHPDVSSIILVTNTEDHAALSIESKKYPKVCSVVMGGSSRSESVRSGIEACPPHTEIVLVHDAARPLVSKALISRVIKGVLDTGAAVPGIPISDTIKRIDSNCLIRATIPRKDSISGEQLSGLTSVQTPQGASIELLRAAYRQFNLDEYEPTDESSLLENLGVPVVVVQGDSFNIKITHQEDISLAEKLMKSYSPSKFPEYRTGFGYDVHAFSTPEAGRKLFLGGVEIPHDRGLEGHSDADVLLHAICDALLGAVSLGDIGILFPNTDERYRGVSSLELLAVVRDRIKEAGWSVVNIDAAVTAEAPKLMPHRENMQKAIAKCLGIADSRISIKATTSEKMGFVGRGEGIACWAAAMLRSV